MQSPIYASTARDDNQLESPLTPRVVIHDLGKYTSQFLLMFDCHEAALQVALTSYNKLTQVHRIQNSPLLSFRLKFIQFHLKMAWFCRSSKRDSCIPVNFCSKNFTNFSPRLHPLCCIHDFHDYSIDTSDRRTL